jgi:hypothetical protein
MRKTEESSATGTQVEDTVGSAFLKGPPQTRDHGRVKIAKAENELKRNSPVNPMFLRSGKTS